MNPTLDDQSIYVESRPERRAKLPAPEAVTTRRNVLESALSNLSSAVSASVSITEEALSANEGPVQMDNQRLAEVIENAQGTQKTVDETKQEVFGGDGSDLAELRRQVAAAYPSDIERGGI